MNKNAITEIRRWAIVLAIALAFFYGLDHALMGAQGLPLSWNMSPAS